MIKVTDAMLNVVNDYNSKTRTMTDTELAKRIIELHEANKPKPEPIGYGLVIKGVLHATKDEAGSVGFVPLYTAPPKREPLSEEWTPCLKLPVIVHVRKQRENETHVSTREGITPVRPDDLIMRGVSGEEYPIGKDIFNKTYTLYTTPPTQEPLTPRNSDTT